MPSEKLLDHFAGPLELERRWRVNGLHYAATAETWLANLDERRDAVAAALAERPGPDAERWIGRWRLFFLAVAGTFGWDEGREWFVSHSLRRPSL